MRDQHCFELLNKLRQQADTLYRQAKWAEADQQYQTITRYFPDDIEFWQRRLECSRKMGYDVLTVLILHDAFFIHPEWENILKESSENIVHQSDMKLDRFDRCDEFNRLRSEGTSSRNEELQIERSLLPPSQQMFTVDGFCYLCQKKVAFKVGFEFSEKVGDTIVPNWREYLNCPLCGVNNRMRAAIHLLLTQFHLDANSAIYVTEQTGSFWYWVKERFPQLIGSEYLGDSIPLGSENSEHFRNEDLTQLTFADNSLDYVFNFDVLEHVPDLKKGLAECFRVLKPGGTLFFTTPFYPNLTQNRIIARVDASGNLHYEGAPIYHYNPIDPKGSLVFTLFGWELLDDIRMAGFQNVRTYRCWSRDYGHLGDKVFIICGEKIQSDSVKISTVTMQQTNAHSKIQEKRINSLDLLTIWTNSRY